MERQGIFCTFDTELLCEPIDLVLTIFYNIGQRQINW